MKSTIDAILILVIKSEITKIPRKQNVLVKIYQNILVILLKSSFKYIIIKYGEDLYSQQKQDRELTVAQIMNSLLPNSDLNLSK